jgi:enoyl-CoA hydratase/carnithine racemase
VITLVWAAQFNENAENSVTNKARFVKKSVNYFAERGFIDNPCTIFEVFSKYFELLLNPSRNINRLRVIELIAPHFITSLIQYTQNQFNGLQSEGTMVEAEFTTLKYKVNDHIATICLDRPPANLIDHKLVTEYFEALALADNDPEVRVIVLCGAGKGLSAGVDMNILASFGTTEMKQFLEYFYLGTVQRIRALSKPILASVHGYAREGACTLAFTCDMVIASEDADFAYPGVPNLAAPPGMHVWFLQRLIGRMKAAYLIFTGEPIGAVDAERAGLITKVVKREELHYETLKLAGKIAAMSPLALRTTRNLLYEMEDMNFPEVPTAALKALSESFDSHDSKEARLAFIEKRAPRWRGC